MGVDDFDFEKRKNKLVLKQDEFTDYCNQNSATLITIIIIKRNALVSSV